MRRLCWTARQWLRQAPYINDGTDNREEVNMNKAEFFEKVFTNCHVCSKAQAKEVAEAFISALQDALTAGDSVTLQGLGTFKLAERGAREGRNPRTGETIQLSASRTVRFIPGKKLKEAINAN